MFGQRKASGFAIFPDYETGRRALARLLRGEKYRNLSVFKAVETYAPPEDKNNVENYRKLLKQFTKLDLNRKFKSLTAKEFQIVLDAIQRIEGWKEGSEELVLPARITSVRRDKKGVIVAYQVEKKGWISKLQLIALIPAGLLRKSKPIWTRVCDANAHYISRAWHSNRNILLRI